MRGIKAKKSASLRVAHMQSNAPSSQLFGVGFSPLILAFTLRIAACNACLAVDTLGCEARSEGDRDGRTAGRIVLDHPDAHCIYISPEHSRQVYMLGFPPSIFDSAPTEASQSLARTQKISKRRGCCLLISGSFLPPHRGVGNPYER